MLPSISTDGSLWSGRAPHVAASGACPIVFCADVNFDAALGLVRHNSREVVAVRVLVTLLETEEDEDIALPDEQGAGLRVTRKIKCAGNDEDEKEYHLTSAGVSSAVNWLIKAVDGSTFFVMAKAKSREKTIAFHCLAFLEIAPNALDQFQKYVRATTRESLGSLVTFAPEASTPLRRRAALSNESDAAETGSIQPFDKRRKL